MQITAKWDNVPLAVEKDTILCYWDESKFGNVHGKFGNANPSYNFPGDSAVCKTNKISSLWCFHPIEDKQLTWQTTVCYKVIKDYTQKE